MRKRIAGLFLPVVLSFCVAGCGNEISEIPKETETESIQTESREKESALTDNGENTENSEKESALTDNDENTENRETVTKADLTKQKARMESAKGEYESKYAYAERVKKLHAFSGEELRRLFQTKMGDCYRENTLYATEIKALVMGSLGADVPDEFVVGDDFVDDTIKDTVDGIAGYYKNESMEALLSGIESDEVKDILKDGINTSLDSILEGNNILEAAQKAKESIRDGVIAKIENAPMDQAIQILSNATAGLSDIMIGVLQAGSPEEYIEQQVNEKTEGLIGDIGGILSDADYSGALLQAVSENTYESAAELQAFLARDQLNSKDISSMMYSYSEFGNALSLLGNNTDGNGMSWKACYERIEGLYKQFVSNEILIELLDTQADASKPLPEKENEEFTLPVVEEYEESAVDDQDQLKKMGEKTEEYRRAVEELDNFIDQRDCLRYFRDYAKQVQVLKAHNRFLQEYEIENFKVSYDSAANSNVEENRRINSIISKTAGKVKYVPGAIWLSVFAAGVVSNTDQYYEALADSSQKISEACSNGVSAARDALERLSQVIYLLEDLTNTRDELEEQYINQQLLWGIYGDNPIEVQKKRNAAIKCLYVLAAQMRTVANYYSTIFGNASEAAGYEQQAEMIFLQLGEEGKTLVTKERLAEYLIPILSAAQYAIDRSQETTVAQLAGYKTGFFNLYPRQTGETFGSRISYIYITGLAHLSGHMNIYYFSGEPFLANGVYLYDGIALNGNDNTDGETVYEEAKWMADMVFDTAAQDQYKDHYNRLTQAIA